MNRVDPAESLARPSTTEIVSAHRSQTRIFVLLAKLPPYERVHSVTRQLNAPSPQAAMGEVGAKIEAHVPKIQNSNAAVGVCDRAT